MAIRCPWCKESWTIICDHRRRRAGGWGGSTLDFSSVIATKTQFRDCDWPASLVKVFYISLRIGTRGVASSGMTNVAPSIRPRRGHSRPVLRPVEGFLFGAHYVRPRINLVIPVRFAHLQSSEGKYSSFRFAPIVVFPTWISLRSIHYSKYFSFTDDWRSRSVIFERSEKIICKGSEWGVLDYFLLYYPAHVREVAHARVHPCAHMWGVEKRKCLTRLAN